MKNTSTSTRNSWLATALLCGAVAIYVGSYVALRNRSIQQASQLGVDGLLYDSVNHIAITEDLGTHHVLSYLFAPLNVIDQVLFGGPAPIRCMLFDIS